MQVQGGGPHWVGEVLTNALNNAWVQRRAALTQRPTHKTAQAPYFLDCPAPMFDTSATSPHALNDAEFEMTTADFDRVRKLIHQRAGISLQSGKQAMVYSRLSRRLRETGHTSFASYLSALEQHSGARADSEWQEFVNCLTTNLTHFFREDHHFTALADDLRARAATGARPLRLWCNAASTGEEPYSLAMTVLEALGPGAQVKLVCSDIDTKVLATAQRAVYELEARGLSRERLHRHFLRGTGNNSGCIRVKPELQRLIEFRSFNLMSDQWASLGEPFDLVFCRNVMIYFDAATQQRVLNQIHAVMKPGGLLYVGHSENFSDARELFRLRGKTIYERL
jgi:chemotaxis protein methyltransferase CheR